MTKIKIIYESLEEELEKKKREEKIALKKQQEAEKLKNPRYRNYIYDKARKSNSSYDDYIAKKIQEDLEYEQERRKIEREDEDAYIVEMEEQRMYEDEILAEMDRQYNEDMDDIVGAMMYDSYFDDDDY